MNIKCTPIARRLFAEYLASVDVKQRVTIVHRNGWVDIGGARAFALPNNIIASAGEERVILAKEAVGPYDQAGTLEDWKRGVGALAKDHRFLRFSIATALAGTLLHIGGFESGCFHLYEKSSEGKTTCLRMAASAWGSGADGGYVRTWRSTANGLEAALAGANDTFLPLDEVGQADGRELGQALYMATGGVGKQRMRRDATLRPSHVWRVQVLSSGEHPIQTKLNEDVRRGARAYAGHLVRAIDIRAQRTHGVFDTFEPGDVDPKAFADRCKSAASTHYGTVGPEFVRQLIAQNISAKDVREDVEAFVQDALVGIKDYHGQAARVAERFGLISAAGEYGVQFGILPWERSDSFNDAKALFNAWLERRGGAAPYEARQAVAQVRHFIEAHGDSRFEKLVSVKDAESRTIADLRDPDARFPLNRAGYRRAEGAEERWLIFPEVWTNEVCVGLDASQVASTLASLGMLEPDGEGNPSKSVKISGKARRFYVLTPLIFEGWQDASEDVEAVTVTPVTS
jgi:putative DNA primase/helicase